jgi:PhzF family phenazine biosynthesis protein
MTLTTYIINAFARSTFSGNPAAVCPLTTWLSDELMQQIAMQHNLSETAFFVESGGVYHIRWFTPTVEVNLCGHATLASAYVIKKCLGYQIDEIIFTSRSGQLKVAIKGDDFSLDFPADHATSIATPDELEQILGCDIIECFQGKDDILVVIKDQETLIGLTPDFTRMARFDTRGFIVTAAGDGDNDFVSRGFFPATGINEDPATGSAHTVLTPYWSKRLDKQTMTACQLSDRKGYFLCEERGDRTGITGQGVLYMKGEVYL